VILITLHGQTLISEFVSEPLTIPAALHLLITFEVLFVIVEITICLHNRQVLVSGYLLLMGFVPNGLIFMNVRVVITIDMVIMLRHFRPYGIIFMTAC
jgi:hypothetical protein